MCGSVSVCIAYIYLKSCTNIQVHVHVLYFHSVVYEFGALQTTVTYVTLHFVVCMYSKILTCILCVFEKIRSIEVYM